MTKQPVDGKKILEYILGTLPETETERLDELSLIDPEFAAQLQEAENDLVDAYVKGELPPEALAGFQSHYLASSRRREKVAFAQTFYGVLENEGKHARIKEVPAPVTRLKSQRWFHFSSAQWGFAAAAMLLLGLGAYLMVENVQLQNQVSQRQAEQLELTQREEQLKQELANQRSSDDETRKELARVQQRLAQLEKEPQQQQPRDNGDVQLLAYNLAPQTRGIAKIPLVSVPAGTDFVALNLELEVKDFPAYQAALKDSRTGKITWKSGKVEWDGASNSIILALPASVVKQQNYVLELSGIAQGGVPEVVSTYPFRALIK